MFTSFALWRNWKEFQYGTEAVSSTGQEPSGAQVVSCFKISSSLVSAQSRQRLYARLIEVAEPEVGSRESQTTLDYSGRPATQYPGRVLTSRLGRFTTTLISWNPPSLRLFGV